MRRSLQLAAAAVAATGVYLRWVRPWELCWGATDEEVALRAPGDDLVQNPHLVSTRVVTVRAAPEQVWPWLVQIGRGRAGWYSYDWLDNGRQPSAREILPAFQHMAVGDVVAMTLRKGQPYGPPVLALDPPHSMLWGDAEEPRRFTWLWLLRDAGQGRTRLISRVRCRFSWRQPMVGLMTEFGDPIMMPECLLGIAERAAAAAAAAPALAGVAAER